LLKLQQKELERVDKLWVQERLLWAEHPDAIVIGADEVGRGPLAGPLVAAAVAFQEPLMQVGINDSKKLSHKERELLFERLKKLHLHFAVAVISHLEIGKGNLHILSLQALENAVRALKVTPRLVLIDGRYPLRCDDLPQRPVIGGDRLCACIAAASIMAKVTRDRMMEELDSKYPGYNFAQNKGYPTPDHLKALQERGPCPIHRQNFGPVAAQTNEQLQLFKKRPKKKRPPA
jgi:ribonuclease HII